MLGHLIPRGRERRDLVPDGCEQHLQLLPVFLGGFWVTDFRHDNLHLVGEALQQSLPAARDFGALPLLLERQTGLQLQVPSRGTRGALRFQRGSLDTAGSRGGHRGCTHGCRRRRFGGLRRLSGAAAAPRAEANRRVQAHRLQDGSLCMFNGAVTHNTLVPLVVDLQSHDWAERREVVVQHVEVLQSRGYALRDKGEAAALVALDEWGPTVLPTMGTTLPCGRRWRCWHRAGRMCLGRVPLLRRPQPPRLPWVRVSTRRWCYRRQKPWRVTIWMVPIESVVAHRSGIPRRRTRVRNGGACPRDVLSAADRRRLERPRPTCCTTFASVANRFPVASRLLSFVGGSPRLSARSVVTVRRLVDGLGRQRPAPAACNAILLVFLLVILSARRAAPVSEEVLAWHQHDSWSLPWGLVVIAPASVAGVDCAA
mmetsp:Transcript_34921/g.96437  ORF Transcript_34921/g.96437 Transcript_34921/m.96437 type:complete len:426 (+) Transcript_34921:339-1616(+)